MSRNSVLAAVAALGLLLTPAPTQAQAQAADTPAFSPGAPGVGDTYFPLDGNGGYDVQHYLLDVTYRPDSRELRGTVTITAKATQHLSRFNLDLHGLTVGSVTVGDQPAGWTREADELVVTPDRGIPRGTEFAVVVGYHGVPELTGPDKGGFHPTDDGAIVVGEPHGASSWFPVNDHPTDKAAYTIRATVPTGVEVISNGVLDSQRTSGEWTTWTWRADQPLASYLATVAIGQFDLHEYVADGVSYLDAIDPDLFARPFVPRTGQHFAMSQGAEFGYRQLIRTLAVPPGGGQLSFWVNRDTHAGYGHAFVEAHTPGADDWTTLPDRNGHTAGTLGDSTFCQVYPFLRHYLTVDKAGTCTPGGTTGTWSAATGRSAGWEQWAVDLARFAGREVELSITYGNVSLDYPGVFIDDIVTPTGAGSTSFEDDGDVMDGWSAPGAPVESPVPNRESWTRATAEQVRPSIGPNAASSFARQPEIIEYLSEVFGPYPFSAAGGVVDDQVPRSAALETQTRPVYGFELFRRPGSGDVVVAHELAHQWCGDSLAVASWRDIWLNEGFASYADWLWQEHDRGTTTQQHFDEVATLPADHEFWQVKIGDPGPEKLFDGAVYERGAMTLHQLRRTIGTPTFLRLLREWFATRAGGNVTTEEFIALAERLSGQDLAGFFNTWLFTTGRPAGLGTG